MAISPDAIISACSGLGGILVGSGIVVAAVKAKFAQVATLTRDLEMLKSERVASLERRVGDFEHWCQVRHEKLGSTLKQVEHMAADLGNILGWTKKLDAKLDRIAEQGAERGARIDGQETWLQNLDDAFNAHRDRESHR